MTLLAPSLQAFFTDRLMRQLHASGHTIRSYQATWRLLLLFASARTGKAPSELDFADLSVPLITSFLDHLEHERANTVRTRNLRLAAIHSMLACAAPQHPEHAGDIARVLAIPGKRFRTTVITHLSEDEIAALLRAPDPRTWTGRRDHALMLVAVTTGLRASELTGLTRADTHLGNGPHLECHGKGRKDRVTPLLRDTVAVLAAWLAENPGGPGSPAFPTRRGTPMSQDAIEDCVRRHAATAALTDQQEHHAPRPEAFLRGQDAPLRHRRRRHRLVDGSRINPHHNDLPESRPRTQAARPRPHRPHRRRARPLPPAPRHHRLPRPPLIIPARIAETALDRAGNESAGIIAAPGLDLEHRHREVPRGDSGRGPVSRPASTSTTSPASWNSRSATTKRTGSPPAWKTSTTATSTASPPPPGSIP
jgi:integrase/recombinase XerD